MADQRPGVVSNESVALNEQIRTHDDSEARERERVERHAFKAPDQAAAQSALRPRAVVPSTFIVRLVGLPGPVELRNVVDGLELYRSVGDADVNVLVEIDGGTDRVLHIELLLPTMGFASKFRYEAAQGTYVTLEATDEGLRNSQSTDRQ